MGVNSSLLADGGDLKSYRIVSDTLGAPVRIGNIKKILELILCF